MLPQRLRERCTQIRRAARAFQTHQYTATDAEGNTISASIEGPVSVSRAQIEDARPATTADRYTISGGTGIYEGAIGKATCTSVWLMKPQPDTSIASSREGNCS